MRAIATLPVVMASLVSVGACNEPAFETVQNLASLQTQLESYEIDVQPSPYSIARLAYHAPDPQCPQVYRLSTHYEPALVHEGDTVSGLVLGVPESAKAQPPADQPLDPALKFVEEKVFYRGFRAEKWGISRDTVLSAREAGPAAPTAACTPRTWDPIEDAMALGWPKLTARLTAVGETWSGLPVRGKCNIKACVDPQTGKVDPAKDHTRSCVTPSWSESLAGLYTVGDKRYALINSTWTDGHIDPENPSSTSQGAWTTRRALISLDYGRPIWAQATINYQYYDQATANRRFEPIVRTWTLEALDDCPASLVDGGLQHSQQTIEEVARLTEEFSRSDKERSKARREQRRSEARSQPTQGAQPRSVTPPPTGQTGNAAAAQER